jgi:hypothetical protein
MIETVEVSVLAHIDCAARYSPAESGPYEPASPVPGSLAVGRSSLKLRPLLRKAGSGMGGVSDVPECPAGAARTRAGVRSWGEARGRQRGPCRVGR